MKRPSERCLSMPKISKIFALVLVIAITVGFNYGSAQPQMSLFIKEEKPLKSPRALYVPDEIIVKFQKGADENVVKKLQDAQGALERYRTLFGNFRVLKIAEGKTAAEMAAIFKNSSLVEYAEPNYYAYASFIPNDPYYQYQWHLDNATYGGIQMEQAWDSSAGTSSVVVAVIDPGAAYENYPAPAHCHIDTYKAYGGSGNSWWCGLNEPGWVTEPGYGNGWKDYIRRGFNLTGVSGTVTFSYQYRHDLEVTAGVAYDKAFTEISTDGGNSWTTLKIYTGKSRVGGKISWKAESLNLTGYAGQNVLIRFRIFTDETYSDEDGYFDSDGAFFVDEIRVADGAGTIFYDNVESGAGAWETTRYQQAPDLAGASFIAGYDFINSDIHPNDDQGHGTHVAGTIAQTTNNNLGTAGVAFNTALMTVKVLGADGLGTYQQVADGIYYAVNNGAKIISMSLGGPSPASVLENALSYAYSNGVTVFAACGNSGTSDCDYPAAYTSSAIAVGATQYNETKAPYSSYGPSLDIMAPGGNTGVDQNGDGYADGVLQQTFGNTPVDWGYWFYQGTSMVTPHAAGSAALLLAKNSSLTPDQIRNVLQSTAKDLGAAGKDNTYGWGLINAKAALDNVAAVSISI